MKETAGAELIADEIVSFDDNSITAGIYITFALASPFIYDLESRNVNYHAKNFSTKIIFSRTKRHITLNRQHIN